MEAERRLDPHALSDASRDLFDLPETAQAHALQYSMVNFVPLTEPLLDSFELAHIVEIGCERGGHTAYLADYTRKRGARLTVVDPAPTLEVDLTQAQHVTLVRERSVVYLARSSEPADVYFIDGDHCYATVSEELARLEVLLDPARPRAVLLHDTGWPWGRRDCYADPALVDGVHPHTSPLVGSPYEDGVAKFGLESGGPTRYALRAGGARNGVRTAIEDFLEKSTHPWACRHIPGFFGLTVLWLPGALSPAGREAFQQFEAALDRTASYLATLELGRVHLLCALDTARRAAAPAETPPTRTRRRRWPVLGWFRSSGA